jgi:hypothetical protein
MCQALSFHFKHCDTKRIPIFKEVIFHAITRVMKVIFLNVKHQKFTNQFIELHSVCAHTQLIMPGEMVAIVVMSLYCKCSKIKNVVIIRECSKCIPPPKKPGVVTSE